MNLLKTTKSYFFILLIVFIASCKYSNNQSENAETQPLSAKWIDQQASFIDQNSGNYEVIYLDAEEFLGHIPDQGASLEGYFKNDTLYKVLSKFGLSSGFLTNTYYFLDNALILEINEESKFQTLRNSKGEVIGLDYNITDNNYAKKIYFHNGRILDSLGIGERQVSVDASSSFYGTIEEWRRILNHRKKNEPIYIMLQGMWISTQDERYKNSFEGNIRSEFYEGSWMSSERIKIDSNRLLLEGTQDDRLQYAIVKLTEDTLQLLLIPEGQLLSFYKTKD